jgi:UDP-2,3-diacylglucosamine pyrophosphatase LpxH
MKLQYCSDQHLEFIENWSFMEENPLFPVGEILVLAGDIIPLSKLNRVREFFDFASRNFERVYWIPGNLNIKALT